MQRTLREHITYLEQKIEALKKELEEPDKSPSAQHEIRISLAFAPCRANLTFLLHLTGRVLNAVADRQGRVFALEMAALEKRFQNWLSGIERLEKLSAENAATEGGKPEEY